MKGSDKMTTTPTLPDELKKGDVSKISGGLIGAKHYLLELIMCQKEERLGEHVLNNDQLGWMTEMRKEGLVYKENFSRSQCGVLHSSCPYWMLTNLGARVFEHYNEYRQR
jgi:hypothetical protein